MAIVNFTNLDFDQIRISIKDYLRSNSNFTDYDFDGSNLSVLIDILAYNTYISSYNANMVSNEVFIDSATLRENVVSLARNIGYIPRSRTAARANISFFVDVSAYSVIPRIITLKKGIVCTTSSNFGGESYSFIVPEDITVPVVNGIASFNSIDIYEGTYLKANFTVDSYNPNPPQRYILNNPNIDISLIDVIVTKGITGGTPSKYILSNDIFDIDSNSKVFFIQEIEDQKYELLFGDGIFGKKLEEGNYITVNYVVSNGELANGLSQFNFAGTFESNVIINRGISLITTNRASDGGREIESVQSIRNYAPKNYAAQNRAVTAGDFKAIIPRIYPELESVSVFGGEDLTPPQYGKVFIAVKPQNGSFLPSSAAQNLKNKLKKYTVAGIVTEIIDLKYLYIELDTSVYYNTGMTTSSDIVNTKVISNLNKYAKSIELNKYGSRFKYSKVLKLIDDSDESITSNITKVSMRRDFRAALNQFAEYEICFGNEFHINNTNGYNIKTSGFKISGISETVYFSDRPDSNLKTGTIFLFRLSTESTTPVEVKQSVGTINYEKGEILLNPIKIISTSIDKGESIIEVSATPKSNDIIGLNDLYLQLDTNNITVVPVPDNISSGNDISGTTYIQTSSYTNGKLIRE
ncbi:MAG: hypothetical protein ACO3UU_01955 [Minisyncoccia bacterium]